ncbi:MAG: ABC transporter permease [Nitrospirae bacterium]|nr:ABC transporter permease [Nitrospirota bacterium]MCL5236775.1 ABC transporter permease [Nitrospirota bacterium]
MKIRGKTALMTALLVFGFLSFQLVAAQAGEQQYDQKGGPVDTWNRPLEAGFKVGEVYSPVRFMIGLALGILILHFLRSKFPKVIPMVLVRALTSVGVVLIVWELVVYTHLVRSVLLPPPTTVIAKLQSLWGKGYLQVHIIASVQRLFTAFLLAVVTGIPLGFIIANFRGFSDYVDPLLNLIRVIPPPAWLPFAILWFGIGNPPAIYIIWLGSFFPILLNTIRGIKDTQQIHIESILNLGGKRMDVYRRVMLPSAFPTIFTGVRIGFGIGWVCLVTAELVAVDAGLGWMIEDARNLLDTPTVLGGMVVICLLGILFDTILRKTEQLIVRW